MIVQSIEKFHLFDSTISKISKCVNKIELKPEKCILRDLADYSDVTYSLQQSQND